MITPEPACHPLAEAGLRVAAAAGEAYRSAVAEALEQGLDPTDALLAVGFSPEAALAGLAGQCRVEAVQYDERLSVAPELLAHIDHALLADGRWFPLALEPDGAVLVASSSPGHPDTAAEVRRHFPGRDIRWRVALRRDVRWYAEDFLRRAGGGQIGVERTCLAYWRNTMANWRTKLACYRTDMARARTSLNVMRWGLGLVALGNSLERSGRLAGGSPLFLGLLAAGLAIAAACFWSYLRVRRPSGAPPSVQTLVEVTAATLQFLEEFHFLDEGRPGRIQPQEPTKPTMLGRLGDFLACHSTILDPSASFRQRITLARERNVLAAQRTVCACYRTIASRGRTGLALLRTGVAIACLGLGLIKYFGVSPLTAFDGLLVLAGAAMVVDGALWYWPVRAESASTPRCTECADDED